MMMQGEGSARGAKPVAYSGPLDCMTKTFKAEGFTGLQRGLSMSMIREASKCFFRIGLYQPVPSHLTPHKQRRAF
jgi:hypothetical protein